ncbi:MAG TPA: hypothetical protein VD999_01475 [Vitreimonas sp.]|nr:hypothetical protein [Vitreimonas sp.]
MVTLTPQKFQELLEYSHGRCVSLYMPTAQVGADVPGTEIQFKHLMDSALEQLSRVDLADKELELIVKAINEMVTEKGFWQAGHKSLAMFTSPDFHCYFRLPTPVRSFAHVSHRFHLKPLLPLLTDQCEFYVLAISQQHVELLKGNRYDLYPVLVPDLPTNMESVVGSETNERHLTFHTGTTAEKSGRRPASFHGHSSSWKDDKQKYLERFLNAVDKAVTKYLATSSLPLIVSGPEYETTRYAQFSECPNLVAETLPALIDHQPITALHRLAFTTLAPYFKQQEQAAISQYLEEPDERVSNDLAEILRQAALGRVDTLIVGQGVRKWGEFDPATLSVTFASEEKPLTHDLYDLACAQTLLRGGRAYVLPPEQVPSQTAVAATFRY